MSDSPEPSPPAAHPVPVAGSAESDGSAQSAEAVARLLQAYGLPMGGGALAERMGIQVLQASAERVVARMPVEGNTQPYGLLHGGASVVLAETAGSVGAALHAGIGGMAVGVDITATHHKAARTGWVTATATALSRGRTIASYDVAVVDDTGARVCTSRITCQVRVVRSPAEPGAS